MQSTTLDLLGSIKDGREEMETTVIIHDDKTLEGMNYKVEKGKG